MNASEIHTSDDIVAHAYAALLVRNQSLYESNVTLRKKLESFERQELGIMSSLTSLNGLEVNPSQASPAPKPASNEMTIPEIAENYGPYTAKLSQQIIDLQQKNRQLHQKNTDLEIMNRQLRQQGSSPMPELHQKNTDLEIMNRQLRQQGSSPMPELHPWDLDAPPTEDNPLGTSARRRMEILGEQIERLKSGIAELYAKLG